MQADARPNHLRLVIVLPVALSAYPDEAEAAEAGSEVKTLPPALAAGRQELPTDLSASGAGKELKEVLLGGTMDRSKQWGEAFGQQVVKAVERQLDSARFHVTPEKLGPIEVQISMNKEQAQIVVTLMPKTPETENTLNAERLSWLPKGAVILNPGRGALIDDDALLAALDAGAIGHATLDVFRVEPLPADHRYWTHPRVTVTPHIAADTRPSSASRMVANRSAWVLRPLAKPNERAASTNAGWRPRSLNAAGCSGRSEACSGRSPVQSLRRPRLR